MNKKVCEMILDILAPVSTRQFFGMTGDTLNPFLDAIRRDGRFEWMGVRHEEAGRLPRVHKQSLRASSAYVQEQQAPALCI